MKKREETGQIDRTPKVNFVDGIRERERDGMVGKKLLLEKLK